MEPFKTLRALLHCVELMGLVISRKVSTSVGGACCWVFVVVVLSFCCCCIVLLALGFWD